MNREKAMKIIKSNRPIYRDWQEEFDEAVERLEQPITLSDFLGWEEGGEYRRGGDIFKVEGSNLFKKGEECSSGWCNFYMPSDELGQLRNAEKIDEPKYYAKIKGWELIENSQIMHWNVDSEEGDVFISTGSHDPRYLASLTKKEWNELGITDENADFEEVEDLKVELSEVVSEEEEE